MKKSESFLITTWLGSRSRRFVWDGHEPIALDHPAKWVLERTKQGVWIRDISREGSEGAHAAFEIPPEMPKHGVDLALRAYQGITDHRYTRRLGVNVRKLEPIRAAFLPQSAQETRQLQFGQSDLFLYSGVRYFLTDSRRAGKSYTAMIGAKRIFLYQKNATGYQFTAYVPGLRIKLAGEKRRPLQVGIAEVVPEAKLIQSTIIWNKYWWRLNRESTVASIPQDGKDLGIIEDTGTRAISSFVAAAMLGLAILAGLYPKPVPIQAVHETITVALKPPKILPKKPEPTPPPAPVIAKIEPPKPKPPKPEKKLPKPKPPKPEKRHIEVVKKPKPPMHVAKKLPQVIPKPPREIVKRPPEPVLAPAPKPAPDPAILRAQVEAKAKQVAAAQAVAEAKAKVEAQVRAKAEATAQLTKSLGFLSPSSNKPALKVPVEANNAGKYETLNAGADARRLNSNSLNKMANSGASSDGPIDTKSSRSVASNVDKLGRGRGKGFNEVQGRVSVAALYDPNAKGDSLGEALSNKSFSVSGPGHIDESAIEKALAKALAKFQYCYEKSLLSNASLSGTVLMQWTITMGGGAESIKVVRSQLNEPTLHNCLSKELARIHFPSPKGASVMIKYPFAFSSSSL